MSIDLGKPLAHILDEAKKDIAKILPHEVDKTDASRQFQNELYNEEVKRQAYEDMRRLALTIRDIRGGFVSVDNSLVHFDSASFKDKNGSVIKLRPEWSSYIQQFDEALQFSLENAVNGITMMKSIGAVIGDIMEQDAEDLKAECEQFVRMTKHKDDASLVVKKKLQKLADDVSTFTAKIDVALEQAAEPVKTELHRAKDALKGLRKDLKDTDEKIQSLGNAVSSTVAVGASATTAAVLTLNPVAILTASSFLSSTSTGVAFKKAMDERHDIISDIETKEHDIVKLNEQNDSLKQYKTELDNVNNNIAGAFSQIAVFSNIWQSITLDMQALRNEVGNSTTLSKLLLCKISATKDIFKHLIFVFESYVEQVRSM